MSSQTAVFRQVVRDHMAAPPVVVGPEAPAGRVVEAMARARASAAAVVDESKHIVGILTEQDIVRRIACRSLADRPVEGLMTGNVLTVGDDDHLYQAIGFMRRHRLRHMPVVDGAGQLAGMLYLHDALAVAAGPLAADIERLTHEETLEGLAEVKAAQVQLAENLFADNVPAPEIQALISEINNDLYRRILRLLVRDMLEQGHGRPPVAFDAIVMGSGGRGESFLFPDQDNGFVLADYPDEEHGPVDAWLVELASRMTQALDRLGFPLCRGNVMATNPLWRKTLSQWQAQIGGWMRRRHEAMLLFCDIFFDFRPVYGDGALAAALRGYVTGAAAGHPAFLRDMFGVQADHRAGVGMFRRLLTEREDASHKGHVNLKLAGTLPLAEAVRLMALRARVPETGTLARIKSMRAMGLLSNNEADYLSSAFAFITGLQLRQQIRDYRAGVKVSNFVDPKTLTEREVDELKDSFAAINEFRTRLKADLTGQLL
jgi:signal-transduction protein with cAMP-binding, CBS, and nucleotidyltransferase domain